jgi:hypothetical protein
MMIIIILYDNHPYQVSTTIVMITIIIIIITGWWFQTFFSIIYGMSSFPLTNSIIIQDGYCTTNQYNIGINNDKYGGLI